MNKKPSTVESIVVNSLYQCVEYIQGELVFHTDMWVYKGVGRAQFIWNLRW